MIIQENFDCKVPVYADPVDGSWYRVSYCNGIRTYYYKDGRTDTIDKDGNPAESVKERTQLFHSFFDTSLGKEIWRMDDIKEAEKKGYVFAEYEEANREADRNRKYIEEKDRRESNKRLEQSIHENRHKIFS